MITLTRAKENPILSPSDLPWENKHVFNPGVFVHEGNICLLYRAQGAEDEVSRFGLAKSTDGINFIRAENPVYFTKNTQIYKFGVEDARVVKIEDTYFFAFTIVSENPGGVEEDQWREGLKRRKKPQVALTATKDFKTFTEYGVLFPEMEGKDASLFPEKLNGRYWLLYRNDMTGITYFSTSSDLRQWTERKAVFQKRLNYWDGFHLGIGASPIKTEKGWLLFYHAADQQKIYRLGIIFLDINDPTKILYRSAEPIFEPETVYEKEGNVSNVVFTCGAIGKDDKYFIYYGAADHVVGLATVEKKLVLDLL